MTTQEILQGVHEWTNGKIVYDISATHPDGQGNPTKYADLAAALGTNGANVPEGIRKGGMSVKFVQSSDNKYVQFRLMSQSFTTDATKWQGVDDTLIENSDNPVESKGILQYVSQNIYSKIGMNVIPEQFLYKKVISWGGTPGAIEPNNEYDVVIVPRGTGIIKWKNFKPAYTNGVTTVAFLFSGYPSTDTYLSKGDWSPVIDQQLPDNVKYVAFNFNHNQQSNYESDGFYVYSESIYAEKNEVYTQLAEIEEELKTFEYASEGYVPVREIKNKGIHKTGYLVTGNCKLAIYDVSAIRNTNKIFNASFNDWNVIAYCAVKQLTDIPTDSASATLSVFLDYELSGGADGSIHEFFKNVPDEANYIIVNLRKSDIPNNVIVNKIKVDCYGDSLTDEGAWVGEVQAILGNVFDVRNYGIYGQGSEKIAYRAGGKPFYVGSSFQIPAAKTAVQVSLVNYVGGQNIPDLGISNIKSNVNPVYINKVKGYLSLSNNVLYFKRVQEGAAINVSSGAVVYPHSSQERGDISIFWMGTNDDISSYANYVKGLIEQCAGKVLNEKYLVIGLHAERLDMGVSIQDVIDFNASLKTVFGNKFVDQLDYMCHYGLAGLGLTPTAADEEAMAQGKIPPQLTIDGLHYTSAASTLLGKYIYSAIVENGLLGNNKT